MKVIKRCLKQWALLLAVVGAGVSGVVMAEGPGGPDEGFEGPQMHKALERLDLSESQRKQVDDLMTATRKDMRSLMERRRKSMQAMEPGKQAQWNAAEARKKADEYGKVAADMAYQRMEMVSQLRSILNDQQWKELQKMREERQDNFRDRMESRGEGRGDGPRGDDGQRPQRRPE